MNLTMKDRIVDISILQESDIDDLVKFTNEVNKDTRDKDKFLWEFYNAPAGKAVYVIAKDASNGKIVGTQCAIPIDLITESGIIIRSAKSEDTLVHPDYRGLSIFDRMYQLLFEKCKEDSIKYLWGFTSAKKPFLKLGFSIPFDHSQSLMVFNIPSSYDYLSKLNTKNTFPAKCKILALCFISSVNSYKRHFHSSKEFNRKYSFFTSNQSLPDQTADNNLRENGFSINDDNAYLKWRIEKNPYPDKVFNIFFTKDSQIVGSIMFNHHKNGVWYLINDKYSTDITEPERILMLSKSINLLKADKNLPVNLIRTWDFTHNKFGQNEVVIRMKAGFVHIDRGISFVWKSLDDTNQLNVMDFNLSRIASQGVI